MKAVTCTNGKFEVTDLPAPEPQKGQLLLDVLRCGICGSDLHARHHADELADVTAASGYDGIFRSSDSVVLGHEFCGEVQDARRGSKFKPGTRVVALPLVRRGSHVHATGLSTSAPGGYAEQVLVEEAFAFAVPNGLPSPLAALTEPMAVALHAVRRGEVGKGQVAIVIGCGPIGLAVIGMLKATGVRTVIASDYSAGRRTLATAVGADIVVDPAVDSPWQKASGHGHMSDASEFFDFAHSSMAKLRRLPRETWSQVYRVAEKAGLADLKHPVIFECVGVPGVIDSIVTSAPIRSRVVVVGVCMEKDSFRPVMAINKEIDLRFVLGYTPLDFRDALHLLADGKVLGDPLVTGTVGLDGVDNAFTALGDPESHAKILIDPRSAATTPER
jgi:threonine dehydrogenase-like Zn-dependent dehydrogenase